MQIDAERMVALTKFTRRFTAFHALTNPLLAIVEAAQLKGRIEVLEQIGVFDPTSATEARQLVDLTLATLLDQYLDHRYDTAPVAGVVMSLLHHVKGLSNA